MRPAFLLLALALLAAPATAQASTAGVHGTTLTFTAGAGERNVVSVSFAGSRVRVTDSGAQPVAGAGCTLDRRTVSCPRAGLTDFVADLADQRDRLTLGRSVTLRSRVRGGSGNDSFVSGSGPDELDGGSGFDVVSYQQRTEGVIVTLAAARTTGRRARATTSSRSRRSTAPGRSTS
jgi:hypothetical protein